MALFKNNLGYIMALFKNNIGYIKQGHQFLLQLFENRQFNMCLNGTCVSLRAPLTQTLAIITRYREIITRSREIIEILNFLVC